MNLKNMKKFIKTNKTTPPINLGVWLFFCVFFRGEKRANYLNKGKHAWKTQRFKNAKTVDMTRFLYVCIQRRIIYSPSHYDDMFISRKALTPVFSSVL